MFMKRLKNLCYQELSLPRMRLSKSQGDVRLCTYNDVRMSETVEFMHIMRYSNHQKLYKVVSMIINSLHSL